MEEKVIGLRVVRGPDWKWDEQDGGEGCVGTVVGLKSNTEAYSRLKDLAGLLAQLKGKSEGSKKEADEYVAVSVIWDSGKKNIYRAGYQGAYDLRILDSNLVKGVTHLGIHCKGSLDGIPCKTKEVVGMRWQCAECDTDLCSTCFFSSQGRHDPNHTVFKRYENPTAQPIEIKVDSNKVGVDLWGMFPGAIVKRGHDWDIQNKEDSGGTGVVIPLPTGTRKVNGEILVRWTSTQKAYPYRRGLEGKMDLKVLAAVNAGVYHPEWLPVLSITGREVGEESELKDFDVGHRVKIIATITLDELVKKQKNHGGWNPHMGKIIGKIGTVCRIDSDGDVQVEFNEGNGKWLFNPIVLERLSPHMIGQLVRVRSDKATFEALMGKLGLEGAASTVTHGKMGCVIVDIKEGDKKDGGPDIIVEMGTEKKTLKPAWIQVVHYLSELQNRKAKIDRKLASLFVDAAYRNHLPLTENLFVNHKVPVDAKHENKKGVTALHMACFVGNGKMVDFLLRNNAIPMTPDDKGRHAVYFAVKGHQLDVLKLLKEKCEQTKLKLNATTRKLVTPLQKAIVKGYVDIAEWLIGQNCSIDLQNSTGNTPLMIAALKRGRQIKVDGKIQVSKMFELLWKAGANVNIRNNKGCNVFHVAIAANNLSVVQYILDNKSELALEMIGETQTTALHFACKMGHYEVSKLIVENLRGLSPVSPAASSVPESESNISFSDRINVRDAFGHTPLMLACRSGNYATVELMVDNGAVVGAMDADRNTAIIHTARFIKEEKSGQDDEPSSDDDECKSIMHRSVIKMKAAITKMKIPNGRKSLKISEIYNRYTADEYKETMIKYPALSIICFLTELGCIWNASNINGITAAKILEDGGVILFLNYVAEENKQQSVDTGEVAPTVPNNNLAQTSSSFPTRSDVVFEKCGRCPYPIIWGTFSCNHFVMFCHQCDLICPTCARAAEPKPSQPSQHQHQNVGDMSSTENAHSDEMNFRPIFTKEKHSSTSKDVNADLPLLLDWVVEKELHGQNPSINSNSPTAFTIENDDHLQMKSLATIAVNRLLQLQSTAISNPDSPNAPQQQHQPKSSSGQSASVFIECTDRPAHQPESLSTESAFNLGQPSTSLDEFSSNSTVEQIPHPAANSLPQAIQQESFTQIETTNIGSLCTSFAADDQQGVIALSRQNSQDSTSAAVNPSASSSRIHADNNTQKIFEVDVEVGEGKVEKWQYNPEGSRKHADALSDLKGNTFTKSSKHKWQCTKQTKEGKGKCKVTVKQVEVKKKYQLVLGFKHDHDAKASTEAASNNKSRHGNKTNHGDDNPDKPPTSTSKKQRLD